MSLRVLLINYEFPPLGGGAGNATANIARGLAQRDVEVRVLTSRWRQLPAEERRDGYTILRVPVLRRRADRCSPAEMLTFIAGGLAPAIALGRTWHPDVTCAFFGLPSGPLALELRRLFGIPYLVSLRGGDVPGFTRQDLRVYHRLARPIIREIWARSAGLVANSDGLADLARHTWPDAPIAVIPNGVDLATFQPPRRNRPSAPLRLLCVGRLVRQKGITYLIDALRRCQTPAVLRVVGDGPEGPSLKRQAIASGLATRVEFVGWASRSELPAHYQWADLFVLPSFEEGMPNVVLEAMASGLPIVTTDVYGNRDLVEPGRNGTLVTPANSAAIADAVDALAREPVLLRACGGNSRDLASRRDWARIAEEYRETLSGAAGAHATIAAGNRQASDGAGPCYD